MKTALCMCDPWLKVHKLAMLGSTFLWFILIKVFLLVALSIAGISGSRPISAATARCVPLVAALSIGVATAWAAVGESCMNGPQRVVAILGGSVSCVMLTLTARDLGTGKTWDLGIDTVATGLVFCSVFGALPLVLAATIAFTGCDSTSRTADGLRVLHALAPALGASNRISGLLAARWQDDGITQVLETLVLASAILTVVAVLP